MDWVKIVEGEVPKLKDNTQVVLFAADSGKHVSAEFHLWEVKDESREELPGMFDDQNRDYEWWSEWNKAIIDQGVTHYLVIEPPEDGGE